MSDKNSPAIEIKNLVKIYRSESGKENVALSGINLEIPRGSFFGLLGPNGAGKSTCINILAGLTLKTSGYAAICGFDIEKESKSARRSIGVVPQELVLDPFFPPYEALENTAGYYGIKKSDRKTREIVDAVGLSDKIYSPARSLSGGMRRRLLIAKALVHSPEVLILDEPTAGVDVELRHQLWDYVVKLNKQGTTIVLTTHYLEEAESLCDNIAVINHGKIIANDKKANIMKIIDQKTAVVTPKKPLKAIPKALSGFNAKITDNGLLEITYKSKDTPFNEILGALNASDITISDLSTKEADLEEIFQHLTKKTA